MFYILNVWWNIGTAISEMVSSGILTFFILTLTAISKNIKTNSNITKNSLFSLLFGLSGTIAMITGLAIGNSVSSIGRISGNKGTAFMIPVLAIMQSFHWNAFKSLPMILSFQFIGTLIGVFMYIYFIKMSNFWNSEKIKEYDGLILDNSNYKANSLKEFLAQFLFLLTLFFIFGTSPLVVNDAELMMKGIYSSISLFIIFFLFADKNYFMLSFNISIVSLIFGLYYKKTNKRHLINFLISLSMQLSIMFFISGIDYFKNIKYV